MSFDFHSELIDRYDELKYSLLKAQTFDEDHYGFPPIYYKIMETDDVRVNAYKDAFSKYDFTDKVVCEAGIGTLALTKHFLPQVKKAYLIENNPDLKDFIQDELKKNGWEDKVEVIFDDAMKVVLPEPVDYIVGELMSIYCANEYQIQIFANLRQYLKPEGKLLPEYITNVAQLVHADFGKEHKHYPINFTRHYPVQLTMQSVVNVIDLYHERPDRVTKEIELTPLVSGAVNAVLMYSFVQVAEGCNFTGTDSLMPPTVCKLDETAIVQKGRPIKLRASFSYGTNLDQASFRVIES